MPVFKRPHFEKVINLARKGRIAPVYLLVGDVNLAAELLRRLVRELRAQGHEVEEVDLSSASFEALRARLTNLSLFGRRILWLKNPSASLLKALDLGFVRQLERQKARLGLLLAVDKLSENHPLYLFALEAGVLVPLPAARERDLLRFEIPEILASFGKKMDRRAAEELLSLVGDDLEAIEQELEKLSLYVGERPVITLEDVRKLVSPRPENAPYTLLEAFWQGGAPKALNVLQDLLRQGIHPLVVLATLVTFFKRLFLLRELFEREKGLLSARNYPAFKELYTSALKKHYPERPPRLLERFHPFAAYKSAKQAQRIPTESFKGIFERLLVLDAGLKRGAPVEEEFFSFFSFLEGLLSQAPQGGKVFGATSP